MKDYLQRQAELMRTLMRIFARGLGLAEDFFDDVHRYPYCRLVLNSYPAVEASQLGNAQWGISPHTDYGSVTILLQDSISGLEVRNFAGEWVEVPPVPGSFVINIGDTLAIWSNDIYASNIHRAANPPSGPARLSVVFFGSPRSDAVIDCLPSCTSPSNPPRYQPIECKSFIDQLIAEGYDNRKVAYSKQTMERLKRK
jgi:isopenicillin N synthase-like dioxygenase